MTTTSARYGYLYSTDKETEAWRSLVTCPKAQDQTVVDLALEPRTTGTSETVLEP